MVDPAGSPAVDPAAQYPFGQFLLGRSLQGDHPAQTAGSPLFELGIKRLGLRHAGREVVEDPASRTPHARQDKRQHHLVRYWLAPAVVVSHLTPELRVGLYVGPDELSA